MSKLIVTHMNPDPDAITSVWLLRRFDPEWSEASVTFVPAGNTYQNQPADSNQDIMHVDTGGGMLDHHQTSERTCAAKLTLEYLQQRYEYMRDDEALERLVEMIVQDDHFEESRWPEPTSDRYVFMFGSILDGLKQNSTLTDHGLIDFGSTCLDGIYTSFKLKVDAEQEIEKGKKFNTQWGQGLAVESKNDEVIAQAIKMGFVLVIRKDPEGMVRIKALPGTNVDLTQIYEKVKTDDPKATWFLHASKKMLLNGSYKNPDTKMSSLGLDELIKLF